MLTQCPSCQTTFRVTSDILRVADGQVRCGRCQTQFDALERLIEEATPGTVESGRYLRPPRQTESEATNPAGRVGHAEREALALAGGRLDVSGRFRALGNNAGDSLSDTLGDTDPDESLNYRSVREQWSELDSEEQEQADDYAEDGAEDYTQDYDEFPADSEVAEFEQPPGEAEQDPDALAARRRWRAAMDQIEDDPDGPIPQTPLFVQRRLARQRQQAQNAEDNAEDLEILKPKSRVVPRSPMWKMFVAPLALLLVVQVIHHYRANLARHPQLGSVLMSIYGGLHIPLTPEWNLQAYEVKQWGVLADQSNPGTLRVRASITNRAGFAQPYPLLKLVLEDRWGEQVRAREFEPVEYLDPGVSAYRLLGPQQQTNATITIVDPGPDAEGFRFDVCLRGRATRPVCAGEVAE